MGYVWLGLPSINDTEWEASGGRRMRSTSSRSCSIRAPDEECNTSEIEGSESLSHHIPQFTVRVNVPVSVSAPEVPVTVMV
jgi:hypothetical protein